MSCNKALNIKNVPMDATWEIQEAFCITFDGLTKTDIKGKYILAYNSAGTKYVIWFDDGVVTDPVVASSTLLPVDIASATTPAEFATATKAAVEAVAAANYKVDLHDDVTCRFQYDETDNQFAQVTPAENGTAGVLLELTRVQIGGSIYLGLLDGDVTFDPTVDTQDITAHQTGSTVLGQNITGLGGTVNLTLKEYSPARYRKIFEAVGNKLSGTTLVGMGSTMIGRNNLIYAKQLKLRPVNSANAAQEQYTFWAALPDLGSIAFSGENPVKLPLEFKCFISENAPEDVNVWVYGDLDEIT